MYKWFSILSIVLGISLAAACLALGDPYFGMSWLESQEGVPPWLYLLVPPLSAAAWWIAVLFAEAMAAKATADGVEDWQDLFWPRVLALLHKKKFNAIKDKKDQEKANP